MIWASEVCQRWGLFFLPGTIRGGRGVKGKGKMLRSTIMTPTFI